MINGYENFGERKMHLTMKSKLMSLKDNNGKRTMYCNGSSSIVMISNDIILEHLINFCISTK